MQTRRASIIETLTSVAVGFVVALLSQLLLFPLFGIHLDLGDNLELTAYFTAISIARQYIIRRAFNRWGFLWRK